MTPVPDSRAPGVTGTESAERTNPSSSGGLLGETTLGFLRGDGEELGFAAGEVIIRRGEHHDSFYAVLDGEVALVLRESDAQQRPLALLGPGATFAAESVLSAQGAAIDAVAVTPVRVLRYPAAALDDALDELPSLRAKLLGGVARSLHSATTDVLELLHGNDVIVRLVQGENEPVGPLETSARMRAVAARITRCAAIRDPVLIIGEAGTGRTLAARRLHRLSARAAGPLIAVDCTRLQKEHAADLILGREPAGGRGEAHTSGGIHLAHGGVLVLRNIETLADDVQEAIAAHILASAAVPPGTFPDTRLVATARGLNQSSDGRTSLAPGLVRCFAEVIQIPRLAERPRDIVPLAEAALERLGPEAPRLSASGRHALLSLEYRHRNVAELEDTVLLAARCAEEGTIRAEHVFGGHGDERAPAGADVTGSGLVRWLTQRRGLQALRWLTGIGFAAAVAVCLLVPASLPARAANTLVWSAWEPVVFGLFLLAGPLWCAVCPLSGAGRAVQRWRQPKRSPPAWLQRHGAWLTVAGFAVIVWSERAFHMVLQPRATALMLLCLVAASVAACLLWAREVWCRHLCPLGRLAVALAPAAPLQVTARRQVCASSCTSHDCYKGTSQVAGCTVFHHPLETGQAHHCKLCLACLRSCPHGSVRLEVRPPLAAIATLDERSSAVAAFAFTAPLLALALLLPGAAPAFADPLRLGVAVAAAGAVGLLLHRVTFANATPAAARLAVRAGFALMVVGWGALMADQLSHVPLLAAARIVVPRAAPDGSAWRGFAALPLAQAALILLAALLALVALARIRVQATRDSQLEPATGSRWLPVVLLGYVAVALLLTVSA